MKRAYAVIAIGILMLAAISAGCRDKEPKLEFTDSGGSCGKGAPVIIRELDSEILFSGSIQTPDPCYGLSAELEVKEGNRLIVHISKERREGMCAQCLASVNFSGKIFKLEPGEYQVAVGASTEKISIE